MEPPTPAIAIAASTMLRRVGNLTVLSFRCARAGATRTMRRRRARRPGERGRARSERREIVGPAGRLRHARAPRLEPELRERRLEPLSVHLPVRHAVAGQELRLLAIRHLPLHDAPGL